MAPGRKLDVKVVMCCNVCVEKVEDAVSEMPGVLEYKTDRWNSLLTIVETCSGGPNHKQLLKKLKKATHEKIAEILPRRPETETRATPACTTTVIYTAHPYMGPGYLVPWPPSSSSSPFITNSNYLQHPVGCGQCLRYGDVVCANCGRGSDFGARLP